MRKYLFLLLLMSLQLIARGQTIAVLDSLGLPHPTTAKSMRYWIDDDAGNVTIISNLHGTHTVDVSSLLEGLHTIHYQIIDSEDKVAAPYSGLFLKLAKGTASFKASALHYWFDDNNDVMTCNANAGVQTLDASALVDGLHTLHYQVVDTEGKVSYIASNIFLKMMGINSTDTVSASKLLYWFDDLQETTTVEMTDGTLVIDAATLPDGLHTIHYMVICSDGTISSAYSSIFLRMHVDTESTVAKSMRYWFDDEQTATEIEIATGIQTLDVSHLTDGLHTVHYQLTDNRDAVAIPMSSIFLKMTEGASSTAQSLRYWFDDETDVRTTDVAGGTQSIDVTDLLSGLHTLHYQLLDDKGNVCAPVSGLFMKLFDKTVGSGENVITQYMYWMNDNSVDNKKVSIDKPVSQFQLIALLPMIKVPIRSSEFHFEVTDGTPMMYARNDIHVRFEDALGYWADCSKSFIDYSVSQEVKPISPLTEVFGTVSMQRPESNTINWYSMECKYGDSIGVSASQATSIQIFSPSGEEVYNASGSTSVKVGGLHARDNGTFYIAVHDVTGSNQTMTLNYQHIDRYAILDWDVHTVGNGGCSTITFNGNGFNELYAVDLINGRDTIRHLDIGHESNVKSTVTFDFNSSSTNNYDALFHFTTDNRIVKNAIKVEEAIAITLATNVSYPSSYLINTASTYTVTIRNSGNSTAYKVPVYAYISCDTKNGIKHVKIDGIELPGYFDNVDMSSYTAQERTELLEFEKSLGDDHYFFKHYVSNENGNDSVFVRSSYFFVNIAPNSTKTINVHITSDETVNGWFTVPGTWKTFFISTGSLASVSPLKAAASNSYCCIRDRVECVANIVTDVIGLANTIGGVLEIPQAKALSIADCVAGLVNNTLSSAGTLMCGDNSVEESFMDKVNKFMTGISISSVAASCINAFFPNIKIDKWNTMNDAIDALGIGKLMTTVNCINAFSETVPNCPPTPPQGGSSAPVNSYDPNDIYGYQSETGSKFVSDLVSEMPYRIEFENDTTFATANAHTVVIVDTLDSNVFDLSTFAPSQVKIGDRMETIDGSPDFVKTIDMRPDIYAIAQVQCNYDAVKGIAKWTFTSLDPMTMEPTDDVMQGFLPVNYDGGGIGEVSYTINRKSGLVDGTHIGNKASIAFDSNDAIMTPTWTNIVDNVAPAGRVAYIDLVNDSVFNIGFEGTDNRSGIWKYTLYSQSGLNAPWREVATDIAPDSVYTFKGFDCISYGFCAVATDSAGNVEQKELTAEATKLVTMYGDVNRDGRISVGDYVAIVNIILGQGSDEYNEIAADVNKDGRISIGDCVGLVNYILYGYFTGPQEVVEALTGQPATASDSHGEGLARTVVEDFSIVAGEIIDIPVRLESLGAYTALQMNVTLPVGLSFVCDEKGCPSIEWTSDHELKSIVLSDGSLRIAGYSCTNELFNNSEIMTVRVHADVNATGMGRVIIDQTTMADINMGEYHAEDSYATVTFDLSTGLKNAGQETVNGNVYNVLGQRISGRNLRSGIYIDANKKVVVK